MIDKQEVVRQCRLASKMALQSPENGVMLVVKLLDDSRGKKETAAIIDAARSCGFVCDLVQFGYKTAVRVSWPKEHRA